MNRTSRRRGVSLGSVLLVGTIMLVAAFSMAALASSHLNLSRRQANVQDARNLAEACIAQTVARMDATPPGTAFPSDPGALFSYLPAEEDRFGVASFRATTFRGVAVPASEGSLPAGRKGGEVRLRAVGYSRGAVQTVEALVEVPEFPYAILANGEVVIRAPLEVAPLAVSESGARQAHLGTRNDVEVESGGAIRIRGDVVAGGKIDDALGPEQVEGRKVEGAGKLDIPWRNLAEYEPRGALNLGRDDVYRFPRSHVAVDEVPAGLGFYESDPDIAGGDLTIRGRLKLENDLLYVHRDLYVQGSLSGRGLVVVRGKVTVDGSTELGGLPDSGEGDRVVALLCGGNLTLRGQGTGARFFEGLVYTEGSFTASQVSVAGCFVMAPPASGSAGEQTMRLDEVKLEYDVRSTDFVIQASTPGFGVDDLVGYGQAAALGKNYSGTDPSLAARWDTVHGELRQAMVDGIGSAGAPGIVQPRYYHNRTGDPADDAEAISAVEIPLGPNWREKLAPYRDQIGNPLVGQLLDGPQYRDKELSLILHVERRTGSPPQHIVPGDGLFEDRTGISDPGKKDEFVSWGGIVYVDEQRDVPTTPLPGNGTFIQLKGQDGPVEDFNAAARGWVGDRDACRLMEQAALHAQSAVAQKANRILGAVPGDTVPGGTQSRTLPFDLSQFLARSYPLRITSWRER